MKKVLIGIVIVLAFSMTAAAWDVLGHAFIMEQIKGGAGQANGNELYGITAPDFVNYLMPTPWFTFLYGQTHENFMTLYALALTPAERELAVGFVAHNGLWGADHVAHVSSLTGDTSNGYIINKAIVLEQVYAYYGVWSGLKLDGPDAKSAAFRRELCHNIVEYAIDIAIWSTDHDLASRIAAAAAGRAPSMKRLVRAAYCEPLAAYSLQTDAHLNLAAAAAILQPAEAAFRSRVITYAGLFIGATTPEQVLGNMDPYLRGLAAEMFGLALEPGQAAELLGAALNPQLGLFSDLEGELAATVEYVYTQLASHNIVYRGPGKAYEAKERKGPAIK
jgi:hypothetical protein